MSSDQRRGGSTPPAERPTLGPGSIQTLFDQAFARHRVGDLDQASQLYKQVLLIAPNHADGLHLLGLAHAQSGRPEAAVPLFRQALSVRPDFDLACYNLGNALRGLGLLDEAAAAYQQALRIKPDAPAVLVNLGATLRGLGRLEEAVALYRRAIAREPDQAEAHYNLGCALQQLGRGAEAVQAYRQTVALKPAHADAWANLGAALSGLGRLPEAIAACQTRVELEPASAEAHAALAVAWLGAGQVDQAVLAARRATALRPDDALAHIHLGNGLREQGEITGAIAAYRRAVALAPDDVSAWVNLGVGLQEAGEAAEAAAAISQALAIDPRSAAAWAVHAGLKTFTAEDPDLGALCALLAEAGDEATEDRIQLEFTLGKAFMDMGDADRAFAHLGVGNRLHRARLAYDVRADVEDMAQIARSLTGAELARLGGGGDPSERPLFIVGMPRSGTTLAEQILASHPRVHGAGELARLEHVAAARLGPMRSPSARAQALSNLTASDLAAMGADYVAAVSAIAPGYARVTDKMPSNFRLAGLIHLMLPHARIVHCRRDPVDTCLSCYAQKFSRGQDFTYDLRELGLYYRAYEDLTAHWRSILPPDRFTEVIYEEVVEDLEGQARRLIAFCGLDWDEACLDFHRTARPVRTASVNQVRQPLYRTSVARWKAYEKHLGPLLEPLLAAERF
jgi:tetratricopeptide (TPR) repeat protein